MRDSAIATFQQYNGLGRTFPSVRRRTSVRSNALLGLGLLSSFFCFVVIATLLGTMLTRREPVSISDPLRDIRLTARRVNKQSFITALTVEKQQELAKKVKFVSDIINRHSSEKASRELALSIVAESMRANVDPLLVTAMVKSESTFNKYALSSKGAKGLMQLLPTTAAYTEKKMIKKGTVRHTARRSLSHSDYNLSLGIEYLKYLERMFKGNRELALIAYNWGPGNLSLALKEKGRIPMETKQYAKKILNNHKQWSKELKASERRFSFFDISGIV